jgi:hypothetical protein
LVGECHVAGFTALGTVVQAINAEPNISLSFANGAVLFAAAIFFALIALLTNHLLSIGHHSASAQDFT